MKNQSINLIILFIVVFFGLGSFLPYNSVYLKETLHYSGAQIGLFYSLSSLIVAFSVPILGVIADKIKSPKTIFIISSAIALIFFVPYSILKSFYLVTTIYIIINAFRSSLMPIVDTIGLDYTRKHNLNYGKFKMFSSGAFIVSSLLVGFLLNQFPEHTRIFIYVQMLMLLLSIIFGALQHNDYSRHNESSNFIDDLKDLIKNKQYLLVIFIMGMSYATIQVAQSYLSLSIIELGGREDIVGIAFLFLVIPEVILFGFVLKWTSRIPHAFLMLIGASSLLLRWILLLTTNSITVLLFASSAHGIIMAFLILVGSDLIRIIVKPHLLSSAVSIYTGVANIFFSLVSLVGGILMNNATVKNTYFLYSFTTLIVIFAIIMYIKKYSGRLKNE